MKIKLFKNVISNIYLLKKNKKILVKKFFLIFIEKWDEILYKVL